MKSLKSQKSQVTMLIIIGLVLFIVVGLVLYIAKSAVKKSSTQNIKKSQEVGIDVQPIKELASKCLDKLAKDAITLIGAQGGYIYKSQGGTLVDYNEDDEGKFFVKFNNHNVAYNIYPPKFALPPYSSIIPIYPWTTFPYDSFGQQTFKGYFGISNLPPLEPSEGTNSIQTQIETFIDSNMNSCLDFSIFRKQGFKITTNSSKTSVIIGTSDISINSKIPIIVTSPQKEITELNYFSTNLNVRLRDIYYFMNWLISNEISDAKFDISDTKNERNFFSVQLIKDVYPFDDLIIVSDGKSTIYGNEFEYIFARKNRAPALEYISPSDFAFDANYIIKKDDIIKSELKADDPDEDKLEFKFYDGEQSQNEITFPVILDRPEIKFRVEVTDGQLSDYQIITVTRNPIT